MRKRTFVSYMLLASAMVVATPSCTDEDSKEELKQEQTNGIQEEPIDTVTNENNQEDPNAGVTVSGVIGNHTFVDLGLPSGTKWATYNVGATKVTGSAKFAWGETKSRTEFNNRNYLWSDFNSLDKWGNPTKYTKYFSPLEGVSNDSLFNYLLYNEVEHILLLAEDDAATVNWGNAWRMPTLNEMEELINGCRWAWIDNFNNSGINGKLGTSKTNGNTIFLPCGSSDLGLYLSSELSLISSDFVNTIEFNTYSIYTKAFSRCFGYAVRAVAK